jgi:hypothetical protein
MSHNGDLVEIARLLADERFRDGPARIDGSSPLHAVNLHRLLSFTPAPPGEQPTGPGSESRGAAMPALGPVLEARRQQASSSSEHIAYAGLVLEASVRRQLDNAGIRVGQHVRRASDLAETSHTHTTGGDQPWARRCSAAGPSHRANMCVVDLRLAG